MADIASALSATICIRTGAAGIVAITNPFLSVRDVAGMHFWNVIMIMKRLYSMLLHLEDGSVDPVTG